MIRSHDSLPWRCCGTDWPAQYRYCGWCGRGVFTGDRVLVRVPNYPGGDLAVVANGDVDAESWELLAKTVALTADAFESRAAKKAAALAATDSLAGAPVPAVDRSWSTPDVLTTPIASRSPQSETAPRAL